MSWSDRVRSRWESRARAPGVEVAPGEPVVVDVEAFVERSAQAIWDAMADPTPVLGNGVRVEPVAGTGPGAGRQLTLRGEHAGRPVMHVLTVTAESPPAYGEWVVQTGPGQSHRVQRWIEHTGSGCRVRWRYEHPCAATVGEPDRARFRAGLHADAAELAERWKRLLERG